MKYTDPTGMNLDDWQDNGDGTWTVKSEGAKLWDLYGADWDVLSGITSEEDAKKLHIGDIVGIKPSEEKNKTGMDILAD